MLPVHPNQARLRPNPRSINVRATARSRTPGGCLLRPEGSAGGGLGVEGAGDGKGVDAVEDGRGVEAGGLDGEDAGNGSVSGLMGSVQ